MIRTFKSYRGAMDKRDGDAVIRVRLAAYSIYLLVPHLNEAAVDIIGDDGRCKGDAIALDNPARALPDNIATTFRDALEAEATTFEGNFEDYDPDDARAFYSRIADAYDWLGETAMTEQYRQAAAEVES